jgi:hypothetical protein
MFYVIAHAPNGGPAGSHSLGDNRYGMWVTDYRTAVAWIRKGSTRSLKGVWRATDSLLPASAKRSAVYHLDAADLVDLTDEQLFDLAGSLFASTRFGTASVQAVRAEFERRGLVQ